MDRTERFYRIEQLLRTHGVVPVHIFLKELGISISTLKRDLEYLRERLHAPIPWDRNRRGYYFSAPEPDLPRYELPGLWFNAQEAYALLAMHYLLENLHPTLLAMHILPLKQRIQDLVEQGEHAWEEVLRRIRILPMATRHTETDCFSTLARALLTRQRLLIIYYNRSRHDETQRELSPQRLVHYRDNWYMDAWDHEKKALRTFSVDGILRANIVRKKTRDVSEQALDAELGNGYGIFAGRKTQTAKLRFSAQRARWIAKERWHPKQKGYFEERLYSSEDLATEPTKYILEVPYSNERELIMDILKYGADVEVLSPQSLRANVAEHLQRAVEMYRDV